MTVKEVFEFLRDGKYIVANKGKYNFTDKFYQEKGTGKVDHSQVLSLADNATPQMIDSVNNSIVALKTNVEAQRSLFLNFILASKVPRKLETARGDSYDVNKYSEEGFKVFQQMIKDNINMNMLIRSTTLYYASGTGYKKKIGNYLVDGDWRTDYLEMVARAEEGEQSLKDHITEELDNGEHSVIIF